MNDSCYDVLTCQVCGKSDDTVSEQACGYHADIDGEKVLEIICDACEEQHCDDI